jgi:hypothetical protein
MYALPRLRPRCTARVLREVGCGAGLPDLMHGAAVRARARDPSEEEEGRDVERSPGALGMDGWGEQRGCRAFGFGIRAPGRGRDAQVEGEVARQPLLKVRRLL